MRKGTKFPTLTSDNADLKPWRQNVGAMALLVMRENRLELSADAIDLTIDFYFAKPKSASRLVIRKITKPDIDKLERAILDSLTGIVYRDDAQVTWVTKSKQFGLPERAEIRVKTYPVKSEKVSENGNRESHNQTQLLG